MNVTCDQATAGEVRGHVWIGEADLDAGDHVSECSGIGPAPFHWQGSRGGQPLDFRVGIGELNVQVRPAGRVYSTLPK
jgi:hypothetical protein